MMSSLNLPHFRNPSNSFGEEGSVNLPHFRTLRVEKISQPLITCSRCLFQTIESLDQLVHMFGPFSMFKSGSCSTKTSSLIFPLKKVLFTSIWYNFDVVRACVGQKDSNRFQCSNWGICSNKTSMQMQAIQLAATYVYLLCMHRYTHS